MKKYDPYDTRILEMPVLKCVVTGKDITVGYPEYTHMEDEIMKSGNHESKNTKEEGGG